METRAKYKPFFRINKSVLFLGLTWEDMLPGIFVFLISQVIFKDLFLCTFLAVFLVVGSAILRRKHRKKILSDVVISLITKDVIYVSRDGNSKFDNRRK